jgi:hypothetical protein
MSSLAASAGGAAMQTVGAYYGAAGEKISLELQSKLDEINAKMADTRARDTYAKGEREYGISRLKTGALKSGQRVALADAGFDLGYGTAADILTSTDVVGEIDATTILANTAREAWGHRMDAVGLRSSAAVNRSAAKSINPTLSAVATLLTAGGQVAGQYYSLKSSGAFDKPNGTVGGGASKAASKLANIVKGRK